MQSVKINTAPWSPVSVRGGYVEFTVSLRAISHQQKANCRTPGPNHRFSLLSEGGWEERFGSAVRICFTLAVAKKLITF
jgi:hypothetical protein